MRQKVRNGEWMILAAIVLAGGFPASAATCPDSTTGSVSAATDDSATVAAQDTTTCKILLSVIREAQMTLIIMGADMRDFAYWLLDRGCPVDTVVAWYADVQHLQKGNKNRTRGEPIYVDRLLGTKEDGEGCKIPDGWKHLWKEKRKRQPEE
ncbi:MAG: hypothetical protein OXR72_01755 [Gemmatimonadota bacterium]|nr:hypothetical protein [Gemmatimonadota bacterium]